MKTDKGLDHDEQSELLNNKSINKNNPQQQKSSGTGCRITSIISILLCAVFSVIVYRYFCMSNFPNIQGNNIDKNIMHKHFPFGEIQSFKDQNINKRQNSQGKNNDKAAEESSLNNQLPLIFWTFQRHQQNSKDQRPLAQKQYLNNRVYYAEMSNLKKQTVSLDNLKNLISNTKMIQTIQKVQFLSIEEQLKELILEFLSLITLLQEHGGIIIGGGLILTDTLEQQLQIVEKNPNYKLFLYMNQQNFQINIRNYFFIAKRKSSLLQNFISSIISTIQQKVQNKFPENNLALSTQSLFDNFQTNFVSLLKNIKSSSNQNSGGTSLFLEDQVYILGDLGKLEIANGFLLDLSLQSHFKNLYCLEYQEFQQMYGRTHQIVNLPIQSYKNLINKGSTIEKTTIIQNSFIHKYLFLSSESFNLQQIIKLKSQQQNVNWSIPNLIWTFVTKNQLSNPINSYFLNNLLTRAKQSQFQFIILTQNNLKDVLQQPNFNRISSFIQKIKVLNKNLTLNSQQNHNKNDRISSKIQERSEKNKEEHQELGILSQIIKLQILNLYGGIFIDFGYFLLENLQWVLKMSQNKHVFNKQNKSPSVLMFHNYGDFIWSINLNSGVKQSKNLTYFSHFIAAEKKSELIEAWLRELSINIGLSSKQLMNKLQKQCEILNPIFSNILQDSLQCLLKRQLKNQKQDSKQIFEKKSYRLWSISSLLAGEKIDLVMKGQKKQCFFFNQSVQFFVQNYGKIGYVTQLTTEASKDQIDKSIKTSPRGSFGQKIFINSQLNLQQILVRQQANQIKSIIVKITQKKSKNLLSAINPPII